jgi:hypothetical protein
MNYPTNLSSLRLLSLVSGLPEPKRSRRNLLMLQAFVDESVQDRSLFVMAGYVAPVDKWLQFSTAWQQILDLREGRHRPIATFKMRRLTHARGLHRAAMFYKVIEDYASACFSVRLDLNGMRRALVRAKWPEELIGLDKLSTPYFFAFKAVAEGIAQLQPQLGLYEPVDLIFDEHTSKGPCIAGWDHFKEHASPDMAQYLGSTPAFRSEEEYLPLQAADLYAYWARKWAVDGVTDGVARLAFPWTIKREIPRFAASFYEEQFTAVFENELATLKVRFPEDAAFLDSGAPPA